MLCDVMYVLPRVKYDQRIIVMIDIYNKFVSCESQTWRSEVVVGIMNHDYDNDIRLIIVTIIKDNHNESLRRLL